MSVIIDREKIVRSILSVYTQCDIHSFPVDCFTLLKNYGFTVYSYGELKDNKPRMYELCRACSDDAFSWKIGRIIAYNERQHPTRIRFSLMHEFAHFILKHPEETPQTEAEADYFASYILAPRDVIYDSGCRNADDVHTTFEISYTASNRVWYDYQHGYKTPYGINIKKWFFPPEIVPAKSSKAESVITEFKKPCFDINYISTKESENEHSNALAKTKRRKRKFEKQFNEYQENMEFLGFNSPEIAFARAEHQWLYGNDL